MGNSNPPQNQAAFADVKLENKRQTLTCANNADALEFKNTNNGYYWFSGDRIDVRSFHRAAPQGITKVEENRHRGDFAVGISVYVEDDDNPPRINRDRIERGMDENQI